MNEIYFTLELIGRVVLAALCGIVIGYERRYRYKVAGIKTHMIVGLASALMMAISKYGFADLSTGYDASRIAAQIVSGVGFLGAGIIFKKNQNVHGLTTAAGIWATSGVGMAIGAGMYVLGIACTIIFICAYALIHLFEAHQKNGIQESYRLTTSSEYEGTKKLIGLCDELKIVTYTIDRRHSSRINLDISVLFENDKQKREWVEKILSKECIVEFEHY